MARFSSRFNRFSVLGFCSCLIYCSLFSLDAHLLMFNGAQRNSLFFFNLAWMDLAKAILLVTQHIFSCSYGHTNHRSV